MADPAIIYLDVDDEITAAAARIRGAEPSQIALVIPPGSNIATSRINFRLLAREAQARNRRLAVVAPDAASRAIAASAGLEAFASVSAFETTRAATSEATVESPQSDAVVGAAAEVHDEPRPAAAAAATAAVATTTTPPVGPTTRETQVAPPSPTTSTPPTPATTAPTAPVRAAPPATRTGAIVPRVGRPRSRWLLAGGIVLVGLVVAAAVGAAVYLPAATISVTPRAEPLSPVELTVAADPEAESPDTAGAIVPASAVSFPVTATQTFPATGQRVEESKATGSVTFDSVNTVGPVAVPSGTRVSTLGGIVFATAEAVTVPKASVAGTTIKHGTVSVPVRATKAGPNGNVEAGEITQVPDFLSTQQVSVNNAKATGGGKRTEFSLVTEKDVNAATKALETELTRQFADAIEAGEGVPEGQTLFPATAAMGSIEYDPNPDRLVGDEVESFELTASATGTATAVDVEQVRAISRERLMAGVASGASLVPGSVVVNIGDPAAAGSVVTFPVTASASQVRPLDADVLEAEIMGLPIDDARAILERHGTVTIALWPDWVTSIPTLPDRVIVTVVDGVAPNVAPVMPSVAPSSVPS
jgi:hypothetical protein